MNNFLNLEVITEMTQEEQNRNLRILARVDLQTKLKIFEYQRSEFHKLKQIYPKFTNNILTLGSIILSINEVSNELTDVQKNAIKMRRKYIRKDVKREKLIGYWPLVKELKKVQNMSFREIALYFEKYHKFQVSYSLIYETWNQLEKLNKENNNNVV